MSPESKNLLFFGRKATALSSQSVSAWPFLIGRGWGMIELKTKGQEKQKLLQDSYLLTGNGSGYASSLTRYAVRYDRYSHCYSAYISSCFSNSISYFQILSLSVFEFSLDFLLPLIFISPFKLWNACNALSSSLSKIGKIVLNSANFIFSCFWFNLRSVSVFIWVFVKIHFLDNYHL